MDLWNLFFIPIAYSNEIKLSSCEYTKGVIKPMNNLPADWMCDLCWILIRPTSQPVPSINVNQSAVVCDSQGKWQLYRWMLSIFSPCLHVSALQEHQFLLLLLLWYLIIVFSTRRKWALKCLACYWNLMYFRQKQVIENCGKHVAIFRNN